MSTITATVKDVVGALFGLGGGSSNGAKYEPTPLRAMREITNAESFCAILPYTAFNEAQRLFVLDTGERDKKGKQDALGFAIEIAPQSGATEEMIQVLLPIISSAPIGANIQISFYGDSRIIDQMKASALMRDGHREDEDAQEQRSNSIFRILARRRIGYYLRGAKEPLIPHLPMLIRNMRCVLTFTQACDPRSARVIEDLMRIREGIHATLRSANFSCWDWTPSDLINWCYGLTNPDKLYTKGAHFKRVYDEGRLIRHQIVEPDTICRPTDDGKSLRYGMPGSPSEIHSRLYTVTGYPEQFPLWAMGNLIGDFYQNQLGYPCPFVITMGAHILEQANNKGTAQLKGARATTNATSAMARFLPEFQDKKTDWDIVNKAYADGMGELDMYHQILLMARPDDIDGAETSARSIWRARGFNLVSQQYLQVPGILTSLPMGFTPTMHKFYKRTGVTHRKVHANAINMGPLLGEWKGTTTPVLQLVGRRGQLMALDLFDNKGGNYNFAVAASSGSGKSVLANEIAVGYLGVGAKVFIIDVGRSYEKLCHLLGGTFIEFTDKPDWQICINPFDNIDNINEDMEILKPLVAQMCSPSGTLTDHDRSLIEIAIREAWDKLGKAMTVTDVAQALKDSGEPVAVRLGAQLFPYTKNGMYGRYFEGESNVDFNNNFVVLELEELKSRKDLQSVVLFIMMFRITQNMYREDRSRKKVCIIDEAWDLMGGGNSGKFIEEGYRRARKYGGSFGTLTQSIEDYYKTPASQAALDNADWLFLLKQKKESIEQLSRSGKLTLDDNMKRVLSSVRTEQGLYSEIFINSPAGNGVGRLVVDPFALLLYSSAPEDWAAIQRYQRQGQSVTESINSVLRDRNVVLDEVSA